MSSQSIISAKLPATAATREVTGVVDMDASAQAALSAVPGQPEATVPDGGITLFDALEKQLGLKLEQRNIPMPVVVLDHIEQKPTDN